MYLFRKEKHFKNNPAGSDGQTAGTKTQQGCNGGDYAIVRYQYSKWIRCALAFWQGSGRHRQHWAHLLAPKWPRREYIVSFAWQTPSGNSTAIIEDLSCLCPLNFFSFYEEDALLHFVPARGKEKWLLLCHTTKHCCTIHLYRHAPLCSVLNFAPTSEGGSFTNSTLFGYVHHDM